MYRIHKYTIHSKAFAIHVNMIETLALNLQNGCFRFPLCVLPIAFAVIFPPSVYHHKYTPLMGVMYGIADQGIPLSTIV